MLNGQKLQGPFTAEEVNHMLKAKGMENTYVNVKCVLYLLNFYYELLYMFQFSVIHRNPSHMYRRIEACRSHRLHPNPSRAYVSTPLYK